MGVLPIFMAIAARQRHSRFEVPAVHDKSSLVGEARLFSKSRNLRGLKNGDGNSDGENPGHASAMSATASSPKAVANDSGAVSAEKPSKSWPFAYALGLALVASAVLWAAVAAVIHYL